MDRIDIRPGDCLETLRSIPDCSVDSCVTDPPPAPKAPVRAKARVKVNRSWNDTGSSAKAAPAPSDAERISAHVAEKGVTRPPEAAPARASMDDVILWLRRRDIIIVRNKGGYLRDARHQQTAAELVDYANGKRRRLGLEPFDVQGAP